jgi:signal transduction histidine kinase
VRFAANVTGESVQLPEHVREEVVRIGREALLNAFRHASASLVSLDVAQFPERLELEVADDGRGLPSSATADSPLGIPSLVARSRSVAATDTGESVFPGHWGLIGMRERAIAICGRLNIASEKDRGTRVRLVVPLPGSRWRAGIRSFAPRRIRTAISSAKGRRKPP